MVLEAVPHLNFKQKRAVCQSGGRPVFPLEVYGIDKIKEKKPGKKGLKERTASAPKQILRRGLDDGTERLRGQFRDNAS